MRPEELKNLYPVTPGSHEILCRTLTDLYDTAPRRYKKRRTRRFIGAFAVIAVLAAFTATAYATDLFGLRAERVGKYGFKKVSKTHQLPPAPSIMRGLTF